MNSVTSAPRDMGSQVVTRLASDVFSGLYQPGDLIPKEIDLVEAFGVSRASVRSGLQTLSSLGIVRRQRGQGTVVADYPDWNILDATVTGWMIEYANPNPGFLREIYEFRRSTEPFIASVAARRATARDLVGIEEAFLAMEQSVETAPKGGRLPDIQKFSDADVEFHAAIYRATHNLIWAQLAHILRPAILLVVSTSNSSADELRDSLGRHRQVMESIRLRQPDDAYNATLRVMDRTGFDLGLGGSADDEIPLLPLPQEKV